MALVGAGLRPARAGVSLAEPEEKDRVPEAGGAGESPAVHCSEKLVHYRDRY